MAVLIFYAQWSWCYADVVDSFEHEIHSYKLNVNWTELKKLLRICIWNKSLCQSKRSTQHHQLLRNTSAFYCFCFFLGWLNFTFFDAENNEKHFDSQIEKPTIDEIECD